jgi:thymidylate synthase
MNHMERIRYFQYGLVVQNYNELCKKIILTGPQTIDRTGVGTISLFGEQLRFNLQEGFPAMTTKKLAWKSVVSELLWFIEGSGDERRLAEILYGTRDESKKTIWTANANADYWLPKSAYSGDLGRVYGVQWRHWRSADGVEVDQLKNLVDGLKNDPNGRRHIITAWNPAELSEMALPPCHMFAQFYIRNNILSCQMYQRSADLFLGVPFNIASYALLTHLIAKTIGAEVGELILTFGDVHIYNNHVIQVVELLSREPYPYPTLDLSNVADIWTAKMDDIILQNYKHHPTIVAEMAV